MSKLSQQFNDMDETHLAMSDPIELAKYIIELRGEHQELLDDIENHPDYDQDERFESGYDAGRCSVEIADEKDYEIEKNKKELLEQLERITDLKVQNEKLKEENKVLFSFQKSVDQMEAEIGWSCDEEYQDIQYDELPNLISKLYEENKKLKQESIEQDKAALKQINKLKEEINKLKENSETQKTAIRSLTKQLEYECGDTSDMEGFNEWLKNKCSKEDYKKFYDWFEMSEYDVEFIESEE